MNIEISSPIVPVIVLQDASLARPLAETLLENGLPVAEVTLRTEAGLASITEMSGCQGLQLGAGTVRCADDVKRAVDAGASFLVSPALHRDAIEEAQRQNVPIVPGIATPSELATAIGYGLRTVKFFPAEQAGGIPMLKALNSVYPEIQIMPTGGINADNVSDYLALPNVIACGGSWLTPSALLEQRDFAAIGKLVREALAAC